MADTGDYFGGYPEGCPSNDPRERGDVTEVPVERAGTFPFSPQAMDEGYHGATFRPAANKTI